MPNLTTLASVNPKRCLPGHLSLSDEVSFIPMADVTEGGEWLNRQTRRLKSVLSGFTPFVEGDVLFAKITPCTENGKGAQAVGLKNGVGFGSTEFHVLRAKEGVAPRFIYHLCQSRRLRLAAEQYMIGSAGQQRVQPGFFDHFNAPDLEKDEQSKVAQILDTLDTQVRQTEALIAKLETVKQGLLADLLTRGIDENGQIRPPPEEAPELYTESPLGRIPREWELERLGDLLYELGQGWSPNCSSNPAPEGSWGILKTTAVTWGNGYDEYANKALPRYLVERPSLEVTAGDILITRAGPSERVGVVAFVRTTRPRLMISDKLYRLRIKSPNDPAYIALALSGIRVQKEMARSVSGMAESQTNISQAVIRDTPLSLPGPSEQREIVQKVWAADHRLAQERVLLEKLQHDKAGLMDDFLTGRVRVTPLLGTAETSKNPGA